MYIRPVHAEHDLPTLHTFLETYPLGLLTTHIPHPKIASLQTSHIPFVLDRPPPSPSPSPDQPQPQPLGTLRAHIARANPQCTALLSAIASTPDSSELSEEVLILFNAPVHSYVTPRFYTSTKPSTGKVVPTWNYAAVQVYGRLRVYNSTSRSTLEERERTGEFLRRQMDDLTSLNERSALAKEGKEGEEGWKVEDAPEGYISLLMKAVVGLEVEITRIEGRFKLSQESEGVLGDWKGVVEGFKEMGTEEGRVMGGMVEGRGRRKKGDGE